MKYIRANEASFMSKVLHKTIMKRLRLRYMFLKHWTDTNKKIYSIERNLCKKPFKNTNKSYFENLETKKVTDNRRYHYLPKIHQKVRIWTSLMMVKPYPATRSSFNPETFNQFFSNVVPIFNIPKATSFPMASDSRNVKSKHSQNQG